MLNATNNNEVANNLNVLIDFLSLNLLLFIQSHMQVKELAVCTAIFN